jgi:DNA-binding NtrC family response regulator
MAAASVVQRHARVLVVDDDQTTSQALCAILQNHGYEVDTAFCGKEAVTKAERFNPDLLVSDVCMSATNGLKALIRIVTMLPGCKVLLLSEGATISDISAAVPEHLVFSLTSKPVNPLDFINVIAYMLPGASPIENPPVLAPASPLPPRCSGKRC